MKIIGCKEAKEISLTRDPANPHATALIRKSLEQPTTPAAKTGSETAEMDPKQFALVAKALAGMNDVTKTYFAGLADDKVEAFLAKSAADQQAEAEAAAAEAAKAKEAEAAKAAGDPKVAELQKTVEQQAAVIKGLTDKTLTADLEKRARDEFDGFPGGVAVVVERLKSLSGLPEADRKGFEDIMKAQAAAAKSGGLEIGRTVEDFEKAMPATARIEKAATERAKEDKITVQQAKYRMSREPAWRSDFDAAAQEQRDAA